MSFPVVRLSGPVTNGLLYVRMKLSFIFVFVTRLLVSQLSELILVSFG
jgi:hypothetical protein